MRLSSSCHISSGTDKIYIYIEGTRDLRAFTAFSKSTSLVPTWYESPKMSARFFGQDGKISPQCVRKHKLCASHTLGQSKGQGTKSMSYQQPQVLWPKKTISTQNVPSVDVWIGMSKL